MISLTAEEATEMLRTGGCHVSITKISDPFEIDNSEMCEYFVLCDITCDIDYLNEYKIPDEYNNIFRTMNGKCGLAYN